MVGAALRDIMRQAIDEIWKRRVGFVGQKKVTESKPDKDDLVTDADFASQAIFVRKLGERFPGYGIVAEEKEFKCPCTLKGPMLFFTVDPLDGTKAFGRRQSGGFGPMLSLCTEDAVIAAFVGDAMTKELYYYRPESDKVHRLNFGDFQYEHLAINDKLELSEQYVVLRDNPLDMLEPYRRIAQTRKYGGLFKDIEVQGGGIGTSMARLWKGEIGGYVIKAGVQQPWDILPVWGISEKLGFICMTHDDANHRWVERKITPSMEAVKFETPSIFIHRSHFVEFIARADVI
jgi:fructose-1,6-bisphosphatase/inositol monophosphatase family enzyme